MKGRGLFLGACLLVGSICAQAQTTNTGKITTAGSCSPVVVQPKGAFQIICKDPSLTHAEGIKQAQQIAELLSRLRASTQNTQELTTRLDTIIKDLDDLKVASQPRHLSSEQRQAIVTALKVYSGTTITLSTNLGDAEGTRYMNELESAIHEGLACDEKACGSKMAVFNQPLQGIRVQFNPEDLRKGSMPPQCNALGTALFTAGSTKEHIQIEVRPEIPSGSCEVIVGTK